MKIYAQTHPVSDFETGWLTVRGWGIIVQLDTDTDTDNGARQAAKAAAFKSGHKCK